MENYINGTYNKLLGYKSFGRYFKSMRVTSGANEGSEDLCKRNFLT
jgi:hypothetical protein